MLTMVIGLVFCCVPLAVLFERFVPPRRLPQRSTANDNFILQERLEDPARISQRAPVIAMTQACSFVGAAAFNPTSPQRFRSASAR